jgi:hypothetical protein
VVPSGIDAAQAAIGVCREHLAQLLAEQAGLTEG